MKPTQKIQLDIYKDKLTDFYLALYECKMKDKPSEEILKKLFDAICFDKESILKFLKLTEVQQEKINDKLLAVHQYLFKSKKDSEDYFKVSKESFETFQASDFGKELSQLMKMLELGKQWMGKEETAEAKTIVAVLSWFASALMLGLEKSLTNSMNSVLNTAIAIDEAHRQNFKISPTENGNLLIQLEETKESIEMELFVEKDGEISKVNTAAEDEDDGTEENIISVFLKVEEDQYLQIKPNTDGSCETIHYENVIENNNKLDLSEATIVLRFSAPKGHSEEITEQADGSLLLQHKQIKEENPDKQSTLQIESTDTITLNTNSPEEENSKTEKTSSSVFSTFDEFITGFLRLPENTPDHIALRDKIIISICELVKKYFPNPDIISYHSTCVVTGYVAAQMGWLETEVKHKLSKRKQTYRKYLTDTIGYTLKKYPI